MRFFDNIKETDMDKLKMHSLNKVDENIAKIGKLFPNCLTERKNENGEVEYAIDFDVLRQELSSVVVEGNEERYQFTWPDKKQSILLANAPIAKALRPCREESVNFDTTENLYIEGDNLDVLKLLQETYLGRVKMIYIDPPYNTGNDFVYEDDFAQSTGEYLANSGQYDEEGNRLVQNNESNGRFHTDWLNMIYPRLKLAKDLLSDDGLIFISIDDNEIHNIRKVCDEVFGKANFIDCVIWKKRYGGGAKEKYLISLHEYILVYAKNESLLDNIYIPLTKESIERYYKQKDENFNQRGPYRTHPLEATKSMGERKNLVFSIPAPDGSLVNPKRQWLWGKERVEEAISKGELEFIRGKSGDWSVHTKQYLKEEDGSIRLGKAFSIIEDVYTQHGTNEIIELLGDAQIFSFPKPTKFLTYLLNVGTTVDESDIVLDFFSGSATTAHSIMQLNAEDGGNRKFILVQLPEETDEKNEAHKADYKNICEIGKERIRRAGKKILDEQKARNSGLFSEEVKPLDVGFRVLKLDSTNMKDVYYNPKLYTPELFSSLADNIKDGRTPEDLLIQVMLDLGVLLSSKIEETVIDDKKVFNVDDNYLIACFDDNVTEATVAAIAKQKPSYFVMRDSSMATDSVAVNFEQIFSTYSSETIRRVL